MSVTDIFDAFKPADHEKEAEQRWGHTDAYRESLRRTRRYTPEDWKRHQDQRADIYTAAFALAQTGVEPTCAEAMAVAERHRLSIDQWFYPCSHAMHAGLADLWENDSRFAENIDRFGVGLTKFLAAAVRANQARQPRA